MQTGTGTSRCLRSTLEKYLHARAARRGAARNENGEIEKSRLQNARAHTRSGRSFILRWNRKGFCEIRDDRCRRDRGGKQRDKSSRIDSSLIQRKLRYKWRLLAGCIDRCATSAMAGKGKAQPSSPSYILSPCFSFSLGTMRSPVKYSRQIQMRHVHATNFARSCDFGEFNSRFVKWKKKTYSASVPITIIPSGDHFRAAVTWWFVITTLYVPVSMCWANRSVF